MKVTIVIPSGGVYKQRPPPSHSIPHQFNHSTSSTFTTFSKQSHPPASANTLSQSKGLPVSQISAKMQLQSIIAILSFALVATAIPTGTSTSTTDTTVCKGDNTASYCSNTKSGNSLPSLIGGLLTIIVPVEVSNVLTCTTGMLNTSKQPTTELILRVTVIPIASGNQQVANACCPNNGVVSRNRRVQPI